MEPLIETGENNEEEADKIIEISGDSITEIKPEKIPNSLKEEAKEAEKRSPVESILDVDAEATLKMSPAPQKASDLLFAKTTAIPEISPQIIEPVKKPESTETGVLSNNQESPQAEVSPKPTQESSVVMEKEKIPEPKEEKKPISKTIRTYQGDVVETMQKQKTSMTSMVLAEKKKQQSGGSHSSSGEGKGKKTFLFTVVVAVIIFIAGSLFYFINKQQNALPPEITELHIPFLILPNYTRELSVDRIKRDNIISEQERERREVSIPLGYIIQLYMTTEDDSKQFVIENTDGYKLLVTAQSYFDGIGAKTPSSLGRSLDSDFVFGYHSSLGNNPFLIFDVKSYSTAFAGMLEWEKTMFRDLSPVFKRDGSTFDLSNSSFEDIVIANRDVRALLNENGKIELVYSFPNPSTLIIANNETTIQEMFRRVTNSLLERR